MSDASIVHRNTYELSVENPGLFKSILEKTWDEVYARLQDDKQRKAIENVQLFRLFSELNRVALQLGKGSRPVDNARVVNLFQITGGLPVTRQVELYREAIEKLEAQGEDASAHRAALEQLLGKQGADNALAIEGEAT